MAVEIYYEKMITGLGYSIMDDGTIKFSCEHHQTLCQPCIERVGRAISRILV